MRSQFCSDRHSTAQRLATVILALFAAGCSSATDSEERAENAYLEVTGTSPVPLMVVSSTDWLFQYEDDGQRYVVLANADTVEIDLPAELTVPITGTGRIFFRVINPDSAEASIRIRMLLDERVVFDDSGTLRDASVEYTYIYR